MLNALLSEKVSGEINTPKKGTTAPMLTTSVIELMSINIKINNGEGDMVYNLENVILNDINKDYKIEFVKNIKKVLNNTLFIKEIIIKGYSVEKNTIN